MLGVAVLLVGVSSARLHEGGGDVSRLIGKLHLIVKPLPSLANEPIGAASPFVFGSVAREKLVAVEMLGQLLAGHDHRMGVKKCSKLPKVSFFVVHVHYGVQS